MKRRKAGSEGADAPTWHRKVLTDSTTAGRTLHPFGATGERDVARGFVSTINKMAREAERSRRAQERARVRYAKAAVQQAKQAERFERQAYLEARQDEAQAENDQVNEQIADLSAILNNALTNNLIIDFDKMLKHVTDKDLDSDPSLKLPKVPMLSVLMPQPPGLVSKFLPGAQNRYQKLMDEAKSEHARLLEDARAVTRRRALKLAEMQILAEKHNAEIAMFRDAYRAGDAEGVVTYFEAIFERSEYPEGFSQNHNIAFVPESKQLVVDYEIPSIEDTIPSVEKFRYVKSNDQIVETRRSEKSRNALYSSVLAQIALRLLHEIYSSDVEHIVQVAVVSIFVSTIDKATGRPVRPCLVSVRVSVEQFSELHLERVDPAVCLKQLKANVSGHPSELVAIKPIVDINMFDRRFIEEDDVLSTLDSRPNLLELTPGEFEALITNLFEAMGLEARLTQSSRDGGVDCVAFDNRPIFGGKVVIQAKRYKHTVGVSAVRDLFGTMMNEGASKGILVSTSGYGKAAFDFANGKPIELISGSNLLSLLSEHAGIEAKIQASEE